MEKGFKITKRTDINLARPNERENSWLKQSDATSCGYYLIHNSNYYINIPNYEGNPDAVFEVINKIRRQNGQEPLLRNRNLPSPDLDRYFINKGLNVTSFSNRYYDSKILNAILDRGDFDLVYMTTSSHYTGIVQHQGQLLCLDSLNDGPISIPISEARKRVLGSLGQESNNRYNRVGIIKQQNKKFRVL